MTESTEFRLKVHLRDRCTGVVDQQMFQATAFVCKSEKTVMLNMSDCRGNNALSVAYLGPGEARRIGRELIATADALEEKLRESRKRSRT